MLAMKLSSGVLRTYHWEILFDSSRRSICPSTRLISDPRPLQVLQQSHFLRDLREFLLQVLPNVEFGQVNGNSEIFELIHLEITRLAHKTSFNFCHRRTAFVWADWYNVIYGDVDDTDRGSCTRGGDCRDTVKYSPEHRSAVVPSRRLLWRTLSRTYLVEPSPFLARW